MSTEALAQLISEASRVLIFTGAGISTGSGIPDFRGPGGVWTRRQPVYYDEFLASEEKRIEYWEGKAEAFDAFARARPNDTHRAIATWCELGRVAAVVTQNIDGLHQDAGTPEHMVIEVHGSGRRIACIDCGADADPPGVVARFRETREVPRCGCGGLLKPTTISFGQAMPEAEMRRALEAAAECDLCVALGSTLSVYPAASVPLMAARRRVPYVVINRGETEHDELATIRLEGDVGQILPPAIAALG